VASGKSGAHWQPSLVEFIFRQNSAGAARGLIEKKWLNNQKTDASFSG
jgi:hypothetical protein